MYLVMGIEVVDHAHSLMVQSAFGPSNVWLRSISGHAYMRLMLFDNHSRHDADWTLSPALSLSVPYRHTYFCQRQRYISLILHFNNGSRRHPLDEWSGTPGDESHSSRAAYCALG